MIMSYCRHDGVAKCNGMTSVNISIKSLEAPIGSRGKSTPKFAKYVPPQTSAVVGIVHYKDLEDALTQKSKKHPVKINNR